MSFFSLLVLGINMAFLWTQKKGRRIVPIACLGLCVHALVLAGLQQYFPFQTVLVIIPFAFIESVTLLAISIKLLGSPVKLGKQG